MTTSLDRAEAVRKYFYKTPTKPDEPDYSSYQAKIWAGGFLLFLALISFFSGNGWFILIGIASGYFGFKLLTEGFSESSKARRKYQDKFEEYEKEYALAEPKPSDEQIDKWRSEDEQNIIAEALRRLGLEPGDYINDEPLIIGGPAAIKETKYAIGKDKNRKLRYSHFNMLVIFLTNYNVAAYQAIDSLEHGQVLSDNTQEFPYKEITNLGTKTTKNSFSLYGNTVVSENGLQEFTLATSGSNIINVAYRFARELDEYGQLVEIGNAENTIKAIRKMLKDYKEKHVKTEDF